MPNDLSTGQVLLALGALAGVVSAVQAVGNAFVNRNIDAKVTAPQLESKLLLQELTRSLDEHKTNSKSGLDDVKLQLKEVAKEHGGIRERVAVLEFWKNQTPR